MQNKIRRALISVSNKQDIVQLARQLNKFGIEIISTGGSYKLINEAGVPVIEVAEYTNFPEIMNGRVKTLHHKIHGGILADPVKDKSVLEKLNINKIDLVIVNLYPFSTTVNKNNCSLEEAIENIDIGGPTIIRGAAKNYENVTVVVDTKDYQLLINMLEESDGNISILQNSKFALKAFQYIAQYDSAIADYFYNKFGDEQKLANVYQASYTKKQELRYGENNHQKAAVFISDKNVRGQIISAQQIQGKFLSFNNIVDAETAWECVNQFEQAACVIVKHANPCGVAIDKSLPTAYKSAFSSDPVSAFGGIIAFNLAIDEETAITVIKNQFVEVIIAPDISDAAKKILLEKSNIRVLICGKFVEAEKSLEIKTIIGGALIQTKDNYKLDNSDLKLVSKLTPSVGKNDDLLFAYKVAKFVKSNAIVYAKDGQTLGIGAGQMSRIDSAKIAAIKASQQGFSLKDAVMASDAFFPFRDSVDAAAEHGISAIIQPGGSIKDIEVIEAADQHKIVMLFTGVRHFRH